MIFKQEITAASTYQIWSLIQVLQIYVHPLLQKNFFHPMRYGHEDFSKQFKASWSNREEIIINTGHNNYLTKSGGGGGGMSFTFWPPADLWWTTLDDELGTLLVSLETGMSDAFLSGKGAVIGAFGVSDDALLSDAGAVICSFSVCWNLDIISSMSVI